jgi:LmbE family N-acetylglucosaminyl deacetylase
MSVLVLSPHLDDAVLSCGGLVADLDRVVVATVFNGRPVPPVSAAASRFHARCGHTDENAMAEREKEDDRALRAVGATPIRLGLLEALYRKNLDGTPSYDSDIAIFVDSAAASGEELSAVAHAVRDCVEDEDPDLVLAPLGVGGHIDHLLVAAAARQLDRRVLHYEDVPYVLYDRCAGWADTIVGRAAYLHPCSPRAWSAKTTGIEQYESQRQLLWHQPATWRDDLGAYARTVGGGRHAERFWSFDGR